MYSEKSKGTMSRRDLLRAAPAVPALSSIAMEAATTGPSPYLSEKSGLKITGLRLVEARSRKRLEPYKIEFEKYSAPDHPKSLPMNRYGPGAQGRGDSFDPNLPLFPGVGG